MARVDGECGSRESPMVVVLEFGVHRDSGPEGIIRVRGLGPRAIHGIQHALPRPGQVYRYPYSDPLPLTLGHWGLGRACSTAKERARRGCGGRRVCWCQVRFRLRLGVGFGIDSGLGWRQGKLSQAYAQA